MPVGRFSESDLAKAHGSWARANRKRDPLGSIYADHLVVPRACIEDVRHGAALGMRGAAFRVLARPLQKPGCPG